MPDRAHLPQHHPAALLGLKTAFGLLVRAVGGGPAAEAVLGYSDSRLSEAASLHRLDRWPRLDHVAELEALAPHAHVTATLARLAGFALLPLAPAAGCGTAAIMASLEAAGTFIGAVGAAMADGQISDAERVHLAAKVAALRVHAVRVEATLAGPPNLLRKVG